MESGGGRAGGIMAPRTSLRPRPRPGGRRRAFAKIAGITGDDAAALAALRKLPAEDLVRGLNLMTMGQQRDTYAGPMVDGKIVAEEPETAFRAGRQAKVPYLIGANNREFGFMPLPPQAVDGMLARFGADKDKVVAAYDPEKTGKMGEVGVGLMSDGAMVEPARLLARLASAAGQPTFEYRFSYVASSMRKDVAGALHATEIPFVFETVRAKYGDATTPEDEAHRRRRERLLGRLRAHRRPERRRVARSGRAYIEKDDVVMDFAIAGPSRSPTRGRRGWTSSSGSPRRRRRPHRTRAGVDAERHPGLDRGRAGPQGDVPHLGPEGERGEAAGRLDGGPGTELLAKDDQGVWSARSAPSRRISTATPSSWTA